MVPGSHIMAKKRNDILEEAPGMTRIGVALSMGILIAGCSTSQPPKDRSPIQDQAIKAAEEHLKANGHLSEKYDVDEDIHDDGTRWVFFEFIPRYPGGHCTVVIDTKGKVLRVYPGK